MTIREYAEDVNRSVEDIVKYMERLAMDVSDLDRVLSDEEIILLDNSLQDEEDYVPDEEMVSDFLLDEKAEQIAYDSKLTDDKEIVSKVKPKNNKTQVKNSEFKKERKKIYKHKEKLQSNEQKLEDNVLVYKEGMTVSDVATSLDVPVGQVIMKLMNLGIMATANNSLSYDDVSLLALDFDKVVKKEEATDISNFENYEIEDKVEDLQERPPVVTIMGHVDHGKTTLLDYIRKSNVASGEAGGITQEIGAYQVTYNDKKITFIDTPGHEAFTEMRARGASVTDIVIIIVAADDGIMPQTREAIDHAKAASVPIIVCINKIDKPGVTDANIDRIMTGLVEAGLTPEEWGGDTIINKISALTGDGVDSLLENILLIAEMQELKANPNRYATGAVLESKMDKQVGALVTLLIQNGTLRLGDPIVVGTAFGKVRTLKNDLGKDIVEASPSMPVEITGLSTVPNAGDKFMAFETEKQARHIASDRALREKEADTNRTGMSLEELFGQINEGLKEINVILKTDTNGSLEAVKASLEKIEVEGVKINIIRGAVGGITESDIVLAQASNAIIIGFNVRGNNKVVDLAKEYNIEIRLYDIIYKVVEDMESAMKGMLEPIYEEKVTGTLEVRQLFKFSKVGMIAGCHVMSGIVKINDKARVIRDGIVIYNGSIKSLQHEKDSIKEISKDHDCGLTLENFQDYKENDLIEVYELVEVKR